MAEDAGQIRRTMVGTSTEIYASPYDLAGFKIPGFSSSKPKNSKATGVKAAAKKEKGGGPKSTLGGLFGGVSKAIKDVGKGVVSMGKDYIQEKITDAAMSIVERGGGMDRNLFWEFPAGLSEWITLDPKKWSPNGEADSGFDELASQSKFLLLELAELNSFEVPNEDGSTATKQFKAVFYVVVLRQSSFGKYQFDRTVYDEKTKKSKTVTEVNVSIGGDSTVVFAADSTLESNMKKRMDDMEGEVEVRLRALGPGPNLWVPISVLYGTVVCDTPISTDLHLMPEQESEIPKDESSDQKELREYNERDAEKEREKDRMLLEINGVSDYGTFAEFRSSVNANSEYSTYEVAGDEMYGDVRVTKAPIAKIESAHMFKYTDQKGDPPIRHMYINVDNNK
jgi:hypothetical protein